MNKFLMELRTLFARHVWIALLFGISVSVIVNSLFDYFVFENFRFSKLVGAVVFGLFIGWIARVTAVNKLRNDQKS